MHYFNENWNEKNRCPFFKLTNSYNKWNFCNYEEELSAKWFRHQIVDVFCSESQGENRIAFFEPFNRWHDVWTLSRKKYFYEVQNSKLIIYCTFQDADQLLQTTLRWWEKVPTKPIFPGSNNNELDSFPGATTPSVFPTKKPSASLNSVEMAGQLKIDKSNSDKRDALPVFLVDPIDAFIIRSKSAELSCRVVGADKVRIVINNWMVIIELISVKVPLKYCNMQMKMNFVTALTYFLVSHLRCKCTKSIWEQSIPTIENPIESLNLVVTTFVFFMQFWTNLNRMSFPFAALIMTSNCS